MKDIKEKVRDQSPKIRNPASRLPKELVRSAMLETKEKTSIMADKIGRETGEESPVEYAGNRIERVEQRAGKESVFAAYRGGKKLAVKTYEKLKEQRQKQREAVTAPLDGETGNGGTSAQTGQARAKKGRTGAGRSIKVKPEAEKTIKEAGNRAVKTAPRMVKASPVSYKKVKTQAILQKKQALTSMRAAREAKRAAMRSAQAARQSAEAAKTTARGLKAMAEAAAHAVKAAFAALMAGGGMVFVILILIVGIIGGASFIGSSQSSEPLSAEVLAQRYASEFGIPEYVSVIQAIMMQESGGRGTDPMQASECPYNTQYPNTPGAIQDADYSIKVGVQYYADCVREAGCKSPQDMDKLKLSLQGYNYGNGYITWAIRKHGGYSEANALQFSQEQAAAHGWPRYGDPEYVPHVLRYYSGGGLFAGLFGNGQLVTIAKSQLGNEGGQKFWSWYGFDSREEWCACFVSWCADQAGLIQKEVVPKFSVCTDGVALFQAKRKWQGGGSVPTPGSLIFFDWNQDGASDHVGIVESCDGTTVHTIEGNSGDAVKQNSYTVNSQSILGYGLVTY